MSQIKVLTQEAKYTNQDVGGEALLAINLFDKFIKAEKRVEKIEEELKNIVLAIPEKDMNAYVSVTEQMRREE